MTRTHKWLGIFLAGWVTLGPGIALAATMGQASEHTTPAATSHAQAPGKAAPGEHAVAPERVVIGHVAAVEVPAKTLTITAMRGKEKETIGVDVPDTAKILHGKTRKTLGDLRVGDRVWMKYDRLATKLVADEIRIEGRS